VRIESRPINQIHAPQSASRTRQTEAAGTRPTQESLSLSSTGSLVLSAQQAYRDLPEARGAKVQEVSSALARGRYQVHPQAIADAMLVDD
jgi:flagellar biosynthesis anti-sigma factor FlgM